MNFSMFTNGEGIFDPAAAACHVRRRASWRRVSEPPTARQDLRAQLEICRPRCFSVGLQKRRALLRRQGQQGRSEPAPALAIPALGE